MSHVPEKMLIIDGDSANLTLIDRALSGLYGACPVKRFTYFIVVILLSLAVASCSPTENERTDINSIKYYQDIPGVTAEEITAIEKLKAEKTSLSFGHLMEIDVSLMSEQPYAGFSSEFCELLSGLFGIAFVPEAYDDWLQLKTDIDSRLTDFTSDLTPTPERAQYYYITEHIADRKQKLYTLADAEKIVSVEDANGLKFGFLENSVNLDTIRKRYPDLSFEAIPVEHISSVEGMLLSGEMDALVTEKTLDAFFDSSRIIVKNFFPLAYTPISLTTANSDLTPFISVLDKYISAGGIEKLNFVYKNGEYEYTKLRLKKSFTPEEQSYLDNLLAEVGSVPVALEHDNYPISFYNAADKEFQGIAVDIFAEAGKLTGIRFQNIASEKTTWAEIADALKTGKASITSQLGYSEERKAHYIWSKASYSSNPYCLISKVDFPKVESYQIPSMRIGTVSESVYEGLFKEWFPDSKILVGYPTQNDAFDALENGEIDLVMGAEYMLLTQVNYREKTGYMINYFFDASMNSQLGFNKNETILCSIMDKTMLYIETDAIASYWHSRVFDYSNTISRMQTVFLMSTTPIAIFVLITVFLLLLKNKRLNKTLVERSTALSTIYASIPDTVFSKNTEGVYTSCNPSFERQAGMSEAELIGKTYEEVFGERVSKTVGKYREIDLKVMRDRSTQITDEGVIYPDGSVKLLETLKAPLIQNGNVVGLLGIGRDVTERTEVKNRLNRIVNTAQIAYILTIDGIVVEANEYSQKHFGIRAGEKIYGIYDEPDQRNEIINEIDKYGAATNIVVRYNMADGEVHRFLSSYTPVEYERKLAYIVWAIDIEQDEQKNDRLRVTQQSMQMVLDSLPMPIRIVDLESGIILYVNDSLLELLEYDSADELCGRIINNLLPAVMSDGTPATERVAEILKADDFSIELEYITKTGRIIEALVVSRQIDYNGKRSSIGIIKDLTAEKERAQILLNAVEREKEANQAKSLFLANMSHEIRTPMNGVIGMTDLLLGESLSARQLQYAKDIKTSAESLLDIINDILDLSKISEGMLHIVLVDTDLNSMLKNVVSMMTFAAQSKGLEFIDSICVNSPEYVRVDDVRLKQVIVNLLSNAVKFTKAGYVKLSAKIENDTIVFEVSDTGIGIKKDDIPLIFTAFEQVDTHRNRAIKGTGLGLSISKNLIELMGGRIWVESEYGVGTTFHVEVPYEQGDEASVKLIDTEYEYLSAPTARVLLVDDIDTNLTVGAGLLRLCGITADIAISGPEALELVKAKDYDIVFMDHMMPDMDGIEAMQLIRRMGGKYLKLPIIALTANAVNEARTLLIESGMDDFLSKPINKAELMNILRKWLPEHKVKTETEIAKAAQDTPYTEVLAKAAGIDGLDIGLALSRISDMQDVLEASLKQLANSIGERVIKMEEFLSEGDLRGFNILAHGLKGALANIGAMKHSELAAELEIAAKADNIHVCVNNFPMFAKTMGGFARELQSIFPYAEAANKPQGDSELLRQKVDIAVDCLSKFEGKDALNCLEELKQYTFSTKTDAALSDARHFIEAFMYKKAIPLLKGILSDMK